ncbi:MAG: hypothetical protein JSW15_03695 [Deltaproteobacteria bacterium]|nr:MAG: hypothetical protein JSW15_03695 [Deltaproteobacteria bacterium]
MANKYKYILFFDECSIRDKHLLGGKGANLGELVSAGFPVPRGFGVISTAYEDFLVDNQLDPIREIIAKVDFRDLPQVEQVTAEIRALISNGKIPDDMISEIGDSYDKLGKDVAVAVRSSSAVPQIGISSFPGQMDTFYNIVGLEEVLNHIKLCWASFWTARAASDRWNKGIDHFSVKVSALIQEMVLSEISGVAFTANPVTYNKEELVIEAILGLGEALVSGRVSPETFVLTGEPLTFDQKPERSEIPDDLILKVAEMARRVETHYGQPQDIEWAYAEEELHVLQSRDIVVKSEDKIDYSGLERWNKKPEPDEHEIIWTRAWSDEVLTRAITPLFYSVQADLITATYDFIYKCYGLKELLPLKLMRFHKNRGYFSTRYLMECLRYAPKSFRGEDALKFFTSDQKEEAKSLPFLAWKKLWSEIRLLIFHRKYSFTRCHKTYYEDWLPELLSRVEGLDSLDLDSASLEEIENYFWGMDRLIKEHCEPIGVGVMVHTVAAVTFLGVALEKWIGDNRTMGNLLSGIPENRTFEASLETWHLSRKVKESAILKDIFTHHPDQKVIPKLKAIKEGQAFLKEMEQFLEKYAFKGAEDREISFPRWGDDPTLLIGMLKILVQAGDEAAPEIIEQRNISKREEATQEIMEALARQRWGILKKWIFKFLLKYAQIYSLFRENQRYEIDRVFYGERKAFLAVGKRLVKMGIFTELDDIWFLSKEEAFDALWGKMTGDEITRIIVPRKAEYRRYMYTPPSMFLQGDREFELAAEEEVEPTETKAPEVLTGVAASPGKVTGVARIVHNIRELTRLNPGDILVTNSTDPAWTPAFLLIRGLVLETGGILAHGTVLSREYGLPAVASVKKATELIKDGETITIDGALGTITFGSRV